MSDRYFKRSAKRLLEGMGSIGDIYYNDGVTAADVLVHISRDVQVTSAGETDTAETRDEAELLTEQVGTLKKRDEIHVNGEVWRVERKLSNDGYTVKVVVSAQ